MKVTIFRVIVVVLIALIVWAAVWIFSQRYFNQKEIDLLIERSLENDREYVLEIHNPITKSYSFETLPE